MKLPIPKALERRLAPVVERVQRFLREWEWTWTSAVVFSLALAFFALLVLAVIPSFWLYYAQQNLRWTTFWLVKARDLIVVIWIGFWFTNIFLGAYVIQNARRKLRGEGGDSRPVGGYR